MSADNSTAKAPIARKNKITFILHDPATFKPVGRFTSTTPSLAAKKAASRGFTVAHLRKVGTKIVYVYDCKKVVLDEPKVIKRGESTITFKTVSTVKLLKKYMYNGDTAKDDTVDVPENPSASA